MKRRLFIITISLMFIGGGKMKAQGMVGVNTNTPTENLDVKGTARVRELPLDKAANSIHTTGNDTSEATKTQTFTATSIVLSDTNNVIGRQTKEKFKDEMNRISIEELGGNKTVDLSSLQSHQIKDIYIVDDHRVTLPECNASYNGKVLQFYKWGGANNTWSLTTRSNQGIHYAGTGFTYPTGVSYRDNSLVFDNRNSYSNVGFRMVRLLCVASNSKWFADFGFR